MEIATLGIFISRKISHPNVIRFVDMIELRRERIAERIMALQELVPTVNKVSIFHLLYGSARCWIQILWRLVSCFCKWSQDTHVTSKKTVACDTNEQQSDPISVPCLFFFYHFLSLELCCQNETLCLIISVCET
ncbi:uncharacterized protein LOC111213822 isoform X3 [Brassica napus]|uniref:uncharacterized protein LOC111213822 isoform X3 n=1 Tax=Brassica napus TaxID=3708 RepID=UPI002079CDCA|nr:uncharacterized protein LOC111213822 isoform X3 [Brassica napus]